MLHAHIQKDIKYISCNTSFGLSHNIASFSLFILKIN